jgi:hypothetical protein
MASVCAICAWPLFVFSMGHYLPTIDNDEVVYFLETKTFMLHGFRGGNFFLNDQVPASRLHSGLHGPVFPALYGLAARLVGWQNYSPYLINLAFFVAAWLLLWRSLRSHYERQIAIALFVLMHGYFFLFLPSMMQESFHISIAIAMAGMWNIALHRGSGVAWAGLFVLTAIAMLTRYLWGVTLPFFVSSFLHQRRAGTPLRPISTAALGFVSLVAGAVSTYAAMRLWTFWTAPATAGASSIPSLSPVTALTNAAALFSFRSIGVFENYPLYFRVSTWAMLVIPASAAWLSTSPSSPADGEEGSRSAARYAVLLLLVPMALQALFYIVDGYRDLRMLAGFHALAGLVFLSRGRLPRLHPAHQILLVATALVAIVINAQLTVEGATSRYRVEWQRGVGPMVDESSKELFATIERRMDFVPSESSYCKTVYGPLEMSADPRLIHLPLGFAFSAIVLTRDGQLPRLRGKYALTYSSGSAMKALFDASSDWRVVDSFDRFTLYRSRVACPLSSVRATTN